MNRTKVMRVVVPCIYWLAMIGMIILIFKKLKG